MNADGLRLPQVMLPTKDAFRMLHQRGVEINKGHG
jgi:hypothetical protein